MSVPGQVTDLIERLDRNRAAYRFASGGMAPVKFVANRQAIDLSERGARRGRRRS
jgi:hypothetical protein